MSTEKTDRILNTLYLPLILAIPVNIIILVKMQALLLTKVEWTSYIVMTLFLLITGGMSVTDKGKKTKLLGAVYLLSGIIFLLLAFIVNI